MEPNRAKFPTFPLRSIFAAICLQKKHQSLDTWLFEGSETGRNYHRQICSRCQLKQTSTSSCSRPEISRTSQLQQNYIDDSFSEAVTDSHPDRLTTSQASEMPTYLITHDKKGQKQCQIDNPSGALNNFHIDTYRQVYQYISIVMYYVGSTRYVSI